MRLGRHPGVQAETGHLAHWVAELILRITGRQRLQGKDLAPPSGDRPRFLPLRNTSVFFLNLTSEI